MQSLLKDPVSGIDLNITSQHLCCSTDIISRHVENFEIIVGRQSRDNKEATS